MNGIDNDNIRQNVDPIYGEHNINLLTLILEGHMFAHAKHETQHF
jgi:hypothetical protein